MVATNQQQLEVPDFGSTIQWILLGGVSVTFDGVLSCSFIISNDISTMGMITRQLASAAALVAFVSPTAAFVSTRRASRANIICDTPARPLLATTAAIANDAAIADAKLKIQESM